MLTRYEFLLRPDKACRPRQEWGYRLYAALLREAPTRFGLEAHGGDVTPISQHLKTGGEGPLIWSVALLGQSAEDVLCGPLEALRELQLEKDGVCFSVEKLRTERVPDAASLLAAATEHSGTHPLLFRTSTAFKSRGQYLNLPTARLIIQSLMKKWNGCISECPIDDEDGEGMEAIAAGLRCRSFQITDQRFYLKGNSVPGFTGRITLENRLSGFHRQLADALLLFSEYAGVGIKTTLGMGGVQRLRQDPPQEAVRKIR